MREHDRDGIKRRRRDELVDREEEESGRKRHEKDEDRVEGKIVGMNYEGMKKR